MEQNSIIEVGSKANVILRFIGATRLNEVNYEANEPYLFLKDCRVVINYSQQNKTGRTDKTVIANSDVKPRNVVIGDIVFSRKIAGLLSTLVNEDVNQDKTEFDSLLGTAGIIYMNTEAAYINDTKPMFVYGEDMVSITDFSYDDATNVITVPADSGKGELRYLVSYSSVVTGTKFNLIKTHVPYMSIEVQGEGNIDKESKNVVMYFGRVSLESVIDFTFIQNSMLNVPLSFHIIDDTDNYVVYED